ncbi:MAG: bifunctional glutamate N-acetyltransferase/amino-acid acetyltransferase ArgJ [Planctomycetota bacterium]|jgi:glutamate N-acetyltransferase/amino-acid N-acetyltransferase|nr:bifunctional glutamate N-acetyltransferase/amino-acid acetyltransferase ArgJ [Planctomycetota bacterium]
MEKLCALENIPGFKIAAVQANIRDWAAPRNDLALIAADSPSSVAAVFTTNQVAAAPVKIDKKHLKASGGVARAILVNAGVANACTGDIGKRNARETINRVANRLGAPPEQVLIASTGVIGRHLPMDRMDAGIDQALASLGKAKPGAFAKAIMTTDLRPKTASALLEDEDGVIVSGACKGSGMMAPNMATMLAFVLTNAAVSPRALRAALGEVTDSTFNMVTVDGDTSTNDSLFVMASGAAGSQAIDKPSGRRFDKFLAGLYEVSMSLSRQIAADGEGATKLVNVRVTGAKKRKDAVAAARSIAQSPLVKTAMFGNDPNWGRIVCALGYSDAKVDESKVSMSLCGRRMFARGAPLAFDAAELSGLMKAKEIDLEVDLGMGKCEALVLTCDFSYDYVKINADYTT